MFAGDRFNRRREECFQVWTVYSGNPSARIRSLISLRIFAPGPASRGYVTVYAGRRSRLHEAETVPGVSRFLASTGGLDPGRIVTIDGGTASS